jgi:putative transposase
MVLDRDKLKKLLKEKGVKDLDDFNAFMREVSKDVVETLLEEELTDHLGFEKHDQKAKVIDNSRNGYTPKTVKSKFGEIGLDVPRDRRSEFEPQIVKKRKKDISGLEEKIISMYARGMTTRDIQAHIKDLYSYEISPDTVSAITDKVVDRAREWQSRPVEPIYAVVYMDAVFLKMRTEGHVRNVAVYTIIGINLDGQKECLGMWVCETESAKYWLSVLNELKNRGLEDVLIFSVDNLKGISEAIEAASPRQKSRSVSSIRSVTPCGMSPGKSGKQWPRTSDLFMRQPLRKKEPLHWSSFRKNGTNAILMSLSPGRRTGVRSQPFLSIPRRYVR